MVTASGLNSHTLFNTVAGPFQVKVFIQPNYLENFVQSTFNALTAEKVRGRILLLILWFKLRGRFLSFVLWFMCKFVLVHLDPLWLE